MNNMADFYGEIVFLTPVFYSIFDDMQVTWLPKWWNSTWEFRASARNLAERVVTQAKDLAKRIFQLLQFRN